MGLSIQKLTGAYYSPEDVVRSLVRWVVRRNSDRLIDPSCGDGRFLRQHKHSVGVEQDQVAAAEAHRSAPWALVHEGDFFAWAATTRERFECAAGNPPFIRYQRFSGVVRERAQKFCADLGVELSGQCSSWAPFLVATAALVKPGGRMAFVVPAEIGHAAYAAPVIGHLMDSFANLQIVAIRKKLFPALSEDCWLLYASGHGRRARKLKFSLVDEFGYCSRPPTESQSVSISRGDLERWGYRLRPFLMSADSRDAYMDLQPVVPRLGDLATITIGYVTGANDFFHLRPSDIAKLGIPPRHFLPSVRSGRMLAGRRLTSARLKQWHQGNEPYLLLHLDPGERYGKQVASYLGSEAGERAREAFKCRVRDPWYSVPNVRVPCAFLSYMSGDGPLLVENYARCVGTNSVHVVYLKSGRNRRPLMRAWDQLLTRVSCEVEGHPLGGGMLKLEPSRAARILLDTGADLDGHSRVLIEGMETLRKWRHQTTPAEFQRQ